MHELVRDKLVKGLGSEVMESVMLQSSFEAWPVRRVLSSLGRRSPALAQQRLLRRGATVICVPKRPDRWVSELTVYMAG